MDTAQSTLNQDDKPSPQEVVVKREGEKDLVVWNAPGRPFKKRDRQFFVTVFAIAGIVSLVIFLAEGLMPVILIISLVFLFYILSTVPPEEVEYRVTTRGVRISNKLMDWDLMLSFSFAKRLDQDVLVLETLLIPGRVDIVIDPGLKEEIRKQISAYIPYEEAKLSGMDKITNWLNDKLAGRDN